MKKPELSILMPYRNASVYIEECYRSIIAQNYLHWELLIVNDHSTESISHIQQLAVSDDRVTLLPNTGRGIVPALVTAYHQASGTYITRMDADDIMPPGRLNCLVAAIKASPPKRICTGRVKYFSDTPISEGYQKYEDWINERTVRNDHWRHLYRECVVASPNWICRKEEMDTIGHFQDLSYPEDYHLVFKWYQSGFQVKSLEEVTLFWREHPERTSRNSANYAQEAFFRLKIQKFVEIECQGHEIVIWGHNKKSKLAASTLRSLGVPFCILTEEEYARLPSENFKLLIAAYPALHIRMKMEQFLSKHELVEGSDWWWL